jgi:mono/diheme cytochrome c family protein
MKTNLFHASVSLLFALFSESALAQADGGQPGAMPVHSAAVKSATYNRYCITCHGAEGDGRGPSAHHLDSYATNFLTGVYKCRSTPSGSLPTDEDIARSIREGLAGTSMPPFNTLGPLEQENLLKTLKGLSSRFAHERPEPDVVIPPETPWGSESVTRGLAVYQNLKCATCHGERGHGAPGGMNLRDDNGNPARVTDIGVPHTLKCGDADRDVYRTLMTGLNGTPMSSYVDVLTPDQAWDLVHYLKWLRE